MPEFVTRTLDDADRLAVVESTGLVGKKDIAEFDDISAMVAATLHAPVAQVTLLESIRSWFVSSHGFPADESPTEISFCAHALVGDREPLIVLDAALDERFVDNPFVIEPPNVRFYVGHPILIGGQNVGTVCAYDFEPRKEVTPQQLRILADLADKAALAMKPKKAS